MDLTIGILFFILAPIIISELVGSIPFGLIFSKLFGHGDIRKIGSGNIGATNALRTGNKTLALTTLVFDVFKGTPVIFFLYYFYSENPEVDDFFEFHTFALIVGFTAILGHCFPVWLKFKGGKGVATTFGVLFAAVPWAGFIAAVTWGIVAGFSRYSSLSALCAVAIVPLVTFIYYGAMPAGVTILIALLVFWRHKENIQRLMAGTESKIGAKKDTTKEQDAPEPQAE